MKNVFCLSKEEIDSLKWDESQQPIPGRWSVSSSSRLINHLPYLKSLIYSCKLEKIHCFILSFDLFGSYIISYIRHDDFKFLLQNTGLEEIKFNILWDADKYEEEILRMTNMICSFSEYRKNY